MTDKIEFVKNNMLDLIPIAKKIKENEIEKEIITRMSNGKPIGLGLNKNIKENEIEKEKWYDKCPSRWEIWIYLLIILIGVKLNYG